MMQADAQSLDVAKDLRPRDVAVVQSLLAAQAPSSAAFLGMGEGVLAASVAGMLRKLGVQKRNIAVAGDRAPLNSRVRQMLAEMSTPITNDMAALLRDWAEADACFDVIIIDAPACPQVGETWFWRCLLPVCSANALVIVHAPAGLPAIPHTRLPGGRFAIVSLVAEESATLPVRAEALGSFEQPDALSMTIDVGAWLQQAQMLDRRIPSKMLMVQGSSLLLHPVKGRPNVVQLPVPGVAAGPIRVSANIGILHRMSPPVEFAMMLKSLKTGEFLSAVGPQSWVMASRAHRQYPHSLQFEIDSARDHVLLLATRLLPATENHYAHAWWSDFRIDHGWCL